MGDPGILTLYTETLVDDNDLAIVCKSKCSNTIIAAASAAGYTGLTQARILYPDLSRG